MLKILVTHRIGGLESLCVLNPESLKVTHRIGGLESFFAPQPTVF